MTRKVFHHEPEAVRQNDLIAATLDSIAELGLAGATVREVAFRAGVTPGLIRRYFDNKERLVAAAYRSFIADLTAAAEAGCGEGSAHSRLAGLIRASVTGPVADSRALSIWAAFIGTVHSDPAMATVHREGYQAFRGIIEQLVGEVISERGETAAKAEIRSHAIVLNALLDGLWIEISMGGDDFSRLDVVRVALDSVATLLGIDPAEFRN
ncbi:TetR family transcriptional regulator C-terminal domain-containing protein [Hoeflea sp. YIM 152468]|uniref:TetR/AcrR family transcriptional regulator n=1 Tax=Hoeflea sp. YIM 152468 TaxID=3031759 RepID=UPI0023DA63F6|nr:TetR family transcriptional regulator C-terminal domain-containing protein [Hoeflea sp. YIM 152468]MDF1606722.1 TetR family transcriptional regulator C-terminal domain-containing protein [Hoeflea sp. YIM 152468]